MSAEFDDGKDESALRTIGEVSKALDIKTHVLRYWEQQFPMLEPLKRSGGRRYYRPEDVRLVERIDYLVNEQGYTLKGAKQVIEQGDETPLESVAAAAPAVAEQTELSEEIEGSPVEPSHESQPVIGDAPIADDGGLASFFGTSEGEAVAEEAPAEPFESAPEPTHDPVAVPAAEPAEQAETVAPSLTREDIIARLKQIHGTLAEAVRV